MGLSARARPRTIGLNGVPGPERLMVRLFADMVRLTDARMSRCFMNSPKYNYREARPGGCDEPGERALTPSKTRTRPLSVSCLRQLVCPGPGKVGRVG